MKQNKMAKIVAILALFGILISIIGTWALIIFGNDGNQPIELTAEEIEMLQQQYLDSLSGSTATGSLQPETNEVPENTAE